MIRRNAISGLVISIALLLSISSANAQWNIKVGYNLGFMSMSENDDIMDTYNSGTPDLEESMPYLRTLHGLELGIRYKLDIAAFELSWSNTGRDREALIKDPSDGSIYDKQLGYSFNTFSFAMENIYGNYGYGANIGWNIMKVKTNIGTSSNKQNILKENYLSSKFYLMWNSEGSGSLSVSIRPYVQLAWDSVDLSDINFNLNGVEGEISAKPLVYGISLLFYNGN